MDGATLGQQGGGGILDQNEALDAGFQRIPSQDLLLITRAILRYRAVRNPIFWAVIRIDDGSRFDRQPIHQFLEVDDALRSFRSQVRNRAVAEERNP